MAVIGFPTENDIGGGNAGRNMGEARWNDLFGGGTLGVPWVKTGLTYSSAAGLVATFTSGTALIGPYSVTIDAPVTVSLPASAADIWVYLELTISSGKVTNAQLVQYTTLAHRPNAVLLALLSTNASTVSGNADKRTLWPRQARGSYVQTPHGLTGYVALNWRPRRVVVFNSTDQNEWAQFDDGISYGLKFNGVTGAIELASQSGNVVFSAYGFSPSAFNQAGETYQWAAFD